MRRVRVGRVGERAHLAEEVELEELCAQLDHLPIGRGQGLDVDGVRLRRVDVQDDADALALGQRNEARKHRVQLNCRDVVFANRCVAADPSDAAAPHDRGRAAAGLHAGPAGVDGALDRGRAVLVGGLGQRLAEGELDDDILGEGVGVGQDGDERWREVDEAALEGRQEGHLGGGGGRLGHGETVLVHGRMRIRITCVRSMILSLQLGMSSQAKPDRTRFQSHPRYIFGHVHFVQIFQIHILQLCYVGTCSTFTSSFGGPLLENLVCRESFMQAQSERLDL